VSQYATIADIARAATGGWDELAQRASPDPRVDGVLLKLSVDGGDRSAYDADVIALADTAVQWLSDVMAGANRHADTYLAPRYQAVMPLSDELIASSDLPAAVSAIALRRLFGAALPDEIRRGTDWADTYLRDLSAGRASLGVADTQTAHVPGRMSVSAPSKTFDWGRY
jgi:phage gp36-like protein